MKTHKRVIILAGVVTMAALALCVSADNCQIPISGSSCLDNVPASTNNTCLETDYSPSNPSETCQDINWEYWFSCGYTPCVSSAPEVSYRYVEYDPTYDYWGVIIGCSGDGHATLWMDNHTTCEQDYVPLTANQCGPCNGQNL